MHDPKRVCASRVSWWKGIRRIEATCRPVPRFGVRRCRPSMGSQVSELAGHHVGLNHQSCSLEKLAKIPSWLLPAKNSRSTAGATRIWAAAIFSHTALLLGICFSGFDVRIQTAFLLPLEIGPAAQFTVTGWMLAEFLIAGIRNKPIVAAFSEATLRCRIAAAAIAQYQNRSRTGVTPLTDSVPEPAQTIAGKLARVAGKPKVDATEVLLRVEDAMRNDHPLGPEMNGSHVPALCGRADRGVPSLWCRSRSTDCHRLGTGRSDRRSDETGRRDRDARRQASLCVFAAVLSPRRQASFQSRPFPPECPSLSVAGITPAGKGLCKRCLHRQDRQRFELSSSQSGSLLPATQKQSFFSTGPRPTHPTGNRIVLEIVQLGEASFDGFRRTSNHFCDVRDAAVASLDCFDGSKTSTIFLGKCRREISHAFFNHGIARNQIQCHPWPCRNRGKWNRGKLISRHFTRFALILRL